MILGMLRVKNEARWIARCLASLSTVVDRILLMDDHSTDDTLFRASGFPKATCFESPFEGLDEARDKNHLLEKAEAMRPEWIVAIDGDEMLSKTAQEQLPTALKSPIASKVQSISMRIWYLWDREDQVRTDGVYGDFHRASIFRPDGSRFPTVNGAGSGLHAQARTGNCPNFHCGNVPLPLRQKRQVLELDLLHFGYLHKEDRVRKYEWYRAADPNNRTEDGYRHMVIGDLFPASSKFTHGGPLQLRTL